MEISDRVRRISPYLFAEISRKIEEAKKSGVDVISLGIGDPDMPTPKIIIDELKRAVDDPTTHQYPEYDGMPAFREAVSKWYKERHSVKLDSDKEVLALIGAKEGSLHACLALVNPGDAGLVPDPAYTVYESSIIFASGKPYRMPLLKENRFLPDLTQIPSEVAKSSKVLFISYPNNPTGAVADKAFYKEVIDFAKDNDISVISDNPYSEIGFDGYKPLSFLEVEGAKEVGVEFNSLSKPYNMTGWRIGMACGNEDIISAMKNTKSNTDSGIFRAVQYAGIKALQMPIQETDKINAIYQKRRDLMCDALTNAGIKVEKPKAAFYIWAPVPDGHSSASFAQLVLEKAGVVVAPGGAYGKHGEGYFRISLTVPDERLLEAVERIKKIRI